MGSLLTQKDYHYYFHRYILNGDEGKFIFQLSEPLALSNQQRIIVKQCVLPKIKVKFPDCEMSFNDDSVFNIPAFYISSPSDVVEKINSLLPSPILSFYPSKKYASKAVVTLHLPPQQKIRISPPIADLLFEGKTLIENKNEKEMEHAFSTKRSYEENTYYLTCNMSDRAKVGKIEIPLVNTLVVQYYEGESQTHLLWTSEETQGELKRGIYPVIELAIRDKEGELVQLKGGVLFIHFKICT